jgi:hypothetical protein
VGQPQGRRPANRVNTDLDDVERAVARGMNRIRHRPDLLWKAVEICGRFGGAWLSMKATTNLLRKRPGSNAAWEGTQ